MSIWVALMTGHVRLVKMSWLIKHAKAKGILSRRQELPEEAFTVEVQFKVPMFIPATVKFARERIDGGIDFRVLAKDGVKPHLTGQLRPA